MGLDRAVPSRDASPVMRLPHSSVALPFLACGFLLSGCPSNTDDDGASTTEHDHGAEHGAEHGASQGTTQGTTAQGTTQGTSAEGTTAQGTADGTTAQGTTEQATTDDHSVDTSADDPAVAYCMCVFSNCHELYHAKWGEDEMAAEAACLMEADALPMNGSDIDMGNFIECRMHFCELAAGDESLCVNALGDAVCI